MLLAALVALLPTLSAQPQGLPACSQPTQELAIRSGFTLCFDSTLRVPVWTVYELTPQNLERTARRPNHFRHDSNLTGPSAYDADFRNSGWVRGHLVPAADMAFSPEAIRDSFLLSNAVPQDPTVNNR